MSKLSQHMDVPELAGQDVEDEVEHAGLQGRVIGSRASSPALRLQDLQSLWKPLRCRAGSHLAFRAKVAIFV